MHDRKTDRMRRKRGEGALDSLLRQLVAVALIAVLAGSGYVVWSWWHDRPVDPTSVELPELTESSGASNYLEGRGEPLVAFLDATDSLPDNSSGRACETLVADTLDNHPTPRELGGLAAGVPDSALRDAMSNHIHAVVTYLGVCGAGGDVAEVSGDVAFSATIVRRLVDQVRG